MSAGGSGGRRAWGVAGLVAVFVSGAVVVAVAATGHDDERSARDSAELPSTTPAVTTVSTRSSAHTTPPRYELATATSSIGEVHRPSPLRVVPFGVDGRVRIYQVDIVSKPATRRGATVLTYQLQLGFDDELVGRLHVGQVTRDGQLAIEVSCDQPGCTKVVPNNDEIQSRINLTVRTTGRRLRVGQHPARLRVVQTNGPTESFDLRLLANPPPSPAFAKRVHASTGTPKKVQTVVGVGRFAYHLISAFDSIWVLGKNSHTVTRLDARTGKIVATIPLTSDANRLAATDSAVYAAGHPLTRINPTDNSTTTIPLPAWRHAYAVIGRGEQVWVAGYNLIARVDPDGTVTQLDFRNGQWMDLAVTGGLVWAVHQQHGNGRVVAFDGATGEIRFDIPIVTADRPYAYPVRLVADKQSVVVGVDPAEGPDEPGGELVVIDPHTGRITNRVPLEFRPEGIVLTKHHIWTSGALVDRNTFTVTTRPFGFSMTRAPDGSIWATGAIPGSSTADGVAYRYSPGDSRD